MRDLYVKMNEQEWSVFQRIGRIIRKLQQLNPGTTDEQVLTVLEQTMESILKPVSVVTPQEKSSSKPE